MSVSIYSVLGFHTQASANKEKLNIPNIKMDNGLIVLSYLPIVGILTGGLKTHFGITQDLLPLSSRVFLVARGILEILGLGLLFLIPDLIVSAHRHFCTENPQAKKV